MWLFGVTFFLLVRIVKCQRWRDSYAEWHTYGPKPFPELDQWAQSVQFPKICNMTAEIIRDATYKLKYAEKIESIYKFTLNYEIGYISSRLQSSFKQMIELYRKFSRLDHFSYNFNEDEMIDGAIQVQSLYAQIRMEYDVFYRILEHHKYLDEGSRFEAFKEQIMGNKANKGPRRSTYSEENISLETKAKFEEEFRMLKMKSVDEEVDEALRVINEKDKEPALENIAGVRNRDVDIARDDVRRLVNNAKESALEDIKNERDIKLEEMMKLKLESAENVPIEKDKNLFPRDSDRTFDAFMKKMDAMKKRMEEKEKNPNRKFNKKWSPNFKIEFERHDRTVDVDKMPLIDKGMSEET